MKKVLVLVSAVFMLAVVATSCNKTGCECYIKTDVTHMAPVFQDENMSSSDCKAKQDELNAEAGIDMYRCK